MKKSNSRKNNQIKGKTLNYNVGVQNRYARDLDEIMLNVIKMTESDVKKIFTSEDAKEFFAQDANISSSARIILNALLKRVQKYVRERSKIVANRMVSSTDKVSKNALGDTLDAMASMTIKRIDSSRVNEQITASVNANIDLIKTISADYVENIRGEVNRNLQNGGDLSKLQPLINKYLNKRAKMVRNKAKNVALDQTRKAYSSINTARMKKLGVKKFEWVHSGGGQEPREFHVKPFPAGLNGGIYSVDDPPVIDPKTGERGLPGTAINCKCTMRPIIEFDE